MTRTQMIAKLHRAEQNRLAAYERNDTAEIARWERIAAGTSRILDRM